MLEQIVTNESVLEDEKEELKAEEEEKQRQHSASVGSSPVHSNTLSPGILRYVNASHIFTVSHPSLMTNTRFAMWREYSGSKLC